MYFRQPRYYGEFKCTGTECAANCCFGWRIDWHKDEIDKVKNAPNCSSELKEFVENSFVPRSDNVENEYMVKLDDHGMCPFQTEDKLCRIQKELGAEYLSDTCSFYPRYNGMAVHGKSVYRGMLLTCQEVVRLLINDEKASELVNVQAKEDVTVSIKYGVNKKDISAHPELKYHVQIVEFFYELIGDKKCSLETNLILGALAAEKLTQLVENMEYDRIPEALKAFRKQIHNASALRSIDAIKPNYNASFGVAEKITLIASDISLTGVVLKTKDGELDVSRYLMGRGMLEELMKDKPFWLRNIALSLFLELGIPFKSKERTIFENYSFFVAAVSCIKLNTIAAAISPKKFYAFFRGQSLHFEGMDNMICGLTGMFSRKFFQNNETFDKVLEALKELGINSPAYLALLVK